MRDMDGLFSHLLRIRDITHGRWLALIMEYQTEIEKTLAMLADGESRDAWLRDLAFCALSQNMLANKASLFAGPVTPGKWNAYLDHVKKGEGFHPEMVCPDSANARDVLDYSRAATFLCEQYRYNDKVIVEKNDICLDFGACLGDTSIYFAEKGAEKSYAFEIDKENLACMRKNIETLNYANIEIVPCAVSNIAKTIYYAPTPGNIGGGRIFSEKPDIPFYEASAITIDGFCQDRGIKPDFIKMDIEGAEIQAIMGGIKTFTADRPKFAICVYHKFEHRFEIPLLLGKLLPDYDYYVKKSHPVYETVFFGCPAERRNPRS